MSHLVGISVARCASWDQPRFKILFFSFFFFLPWSPSAARQQSDSLTREHHRSVSSPCVRRIPVHDVSFGHGGRDYVKEEDRGFPRRESSRRPHRGAHPVRPGPPERTLGVARGSGEGVETRRSSVNSFPPAASPVHEENSNVHLKCCCCCLVWCMKWS